MAAVPSSLQKASSEATWSHEERLVRRAQGGDPSALDELFREHYPRLLKFCRRSLDKDKAEDFTQDAFLRAFTHLNRFDPHRALWPWLVTIARRLWIDDIRQQGRVLPCDVEDPGGSRREFTSPDDTLHSVINREEVEYLGSRLHKAISALNSRERRFVLRRLVQGWSYEGIAKESATSVDAVRNAVFRARKLLRSELETARQRWDVPAIWPGLVTLWRRLRNRIRANGQRASNALCEFTLGTPLLGSFANVLGVIAVSIASTGVLDAYSPRASPRLGATPPLVSQDFDQSDSPEGRGTRAHVPVSGGATVEIGPTKPHRAAPSSGRIRVEIVGPDGEVVYGRQTDISCDDVGADALPQDGPIRAAC